MLDKSMQVKVWSSSVHKDMLLQHMSLSLDKCTMFINFSTMEAYWTAQETMMTDHKKVRSK
jgi:hypothetical protein